MRTVPLGIQSGGTWPAGRARRGYIDTGDLMPQTPAPGLRRAELDRLRAVVDAGSPEAATRALPLVAATLGLPSPAGTSQPVITVVLALTSAEILGERWDALMREIRTSLDIHTTLHHETHSCGSEGTRRAVWYVEVKSGELAELQEDMRYFAAHYRGRGPSARFTWAPCNPIDL